MDPLQGTAHRLVEQVVQFQRREMSLALAVEHFRGGAGGVDDVLRADDLIVGGLVRGVGGVVEVLHVSSVFRFLLLLRPEAGRHSMIEGLRPL